MSIRKAAKQCEIAYSISRRFETKNLNIPTENFAEARQKPNYENHLVPRREQEAELKN